MADNLKKFEKIIEDIKYVRIQGAENVARAGISAYLLMPYKKYAKIIIKSRPTEPLLQNSLKILVKSNNPQKAAKKIIENIRKAHDKISNYGLKLIKNDMNIYTHCHSSTVIDILKKAKKKKKRFVVYTTEVEPLLQGRMTAKEMAKEGIKVVVAPDLAADYLMSKCDLFLFGADAFTKKFLVNKIGTKILCDLAKHYNVPRYSCGILMKYTKKVDLEQRPSEEVWENKNKRIQIKNPAFDKVDYNFVSGIICENGILDVKDFLKKAKRLSNIHNFS